MNDYSKYPEHIQDYMHKAEESVTKRYGRWDESWDLTFKMLADNLVLYDQCMDSIQKHGIYNETKMLKHPLISSLKDLQSVILKMVQQFSLSIWSESKIKKADEDDSDDFLDRLTSK